MQFLNDVRAKVREGNAGVAMTAAPPLKTHVATGNWSTTPIGVWVAPIA